MPANGLCLHLLTGAPADDAAGVGNGAATAADAPVLAGAALRAGTGKFGLKVGGQLRACHAAHQQALRRALRAHVWDAPMLKLAPGAQEGAEGVVELQRKLEALQEQIERMNAEKAAASPAAPSVDPCVVHVAGVSPVAVPDVIAAHFSTCARSVAPGAPVCAVPRGYGCSTFCLAAQVWPGRGGEHLEDGDWLFEGQGLREVCIRL